MLVIALAQTKPSWEDKKEEIINTIQGRIKEINTCYRSGPSLYFYKRLNELKRCAGDIKVFLKNDYNLEILYATLVAWDMNSRAAKMTYFDDFKKNLHACEDSLVKLQEHESRRNYGAHIKEFMADLKTTYDQLQVMETGGRLVSNSKMLHFLFPNMLMPMDRTNTLSYFYGNTNESARKYIDITTFAFEIMDSLENWDDYIDDRWNISPPKIIDNAIILLMEMSISAH